MNGPGSVAPVPNRRPNYRCTALASFPALPVSSACAQPSTKVRSIPCLRRFVHGLPGGESALPGSTPAALGFHFLASARPSEAFCHRGMPRTKGSFPQNCRPPARDPAEVGLGGASVAAASKTHAGAFWRRNLRPAFGTSRCFRLTRACTLRRRVAVRCGRNLAAGRRQAAGQWPSRRRSSFSDVSARGQRAKQ